MPRADLSPRRDAPEAWRIRADAGEASARCLIAPAPKTPGPTGEEERVHCLWLSTDPLMVGSAVSLGSAVWWLC
jgi:hypothetical protein